MGGKGENGKQKKENWGFVFFFWLGGNLGSSWKWVSLDIFHLGLPKLISQIGEKLQTNTNLQSISLVSNVSKLFKKLTSRVSYTRVHCSNSSLRDSSFMLNSIIKESIFLTKQAKHNNEEIELQRRQEQKRRTTREDKNKNNEKIKITKQVK